MKTYLALHIDGDNDKHILYVGEKESMAQKSIVKEDLNTYSEYYIEVWENGKCIETQQFEGVYNTFELLD